MQSSLAQMLFLALSALVGSAGAWTVNPALRAKPAAQEALVVAKSSTKRSPDVASCGKVPTYENAKPSEYKDSMKTKFNPDTKKQEEVTFKKDDAVDFKCNPGFTTDGSKDGPNTFTANCFAPENSRVGYFKLEDAGASTCIKASKCGAVPTIDNAKPTAKKIEGAVQFACNTGYSLDGNKVVAGGMGKNQLFTLKCQEFNNDYEKFEGKCQAYAFVPGTETLRIYSEVTKALFTVTCKGKLVTAFGKGEAPPVDGACAKLNAPGGCAGLVTAIKADFETKKAELKAFNEDKEWYDKEDKPGVHDKAQAFCESLYKELGNL